MVYTHLTYCQVYGAQHKHTMTYVCVFVKFSMSKKCVVELSTWGMGGDAKRAGGTVLVLKRGPPLKNSHQN